MSTTRALVQALHALDPAQRPGVLVSGSAVGFYGTSRGDQAFDEGAKAGNDFLADVCVQWSVPAPRPPSICPLGPCSSPPGALGCPAGSGRHSRRPQVCASSCFVRASCWRRRAARWPNYCRRSRYERTLSSRPWSPPLRCAATCPCLSPSGPRLTLLLGAPLAQFFAGGPLGNGAQMFSWVHRDDLVGLILFALSNEDVQGALNGCVGVGGLPLWERRVTQHTESRCGRTPSRPGS